MDEGMGQEQGNQIAELQKQLTVITSLPSLSIEQVTEIGGRLGAIYHDAEQLGDVALMNTAADTWAIIQANTDTTAIAASAISGLIEAVQQRDSALDELARLDDGIRELEAEGETSNLRLRGAAHVLYETLRERWEDEGLHLDCPGCQAHDTGWGDDIDHDDVNMLCHALFDGMGDDLPGELRLEFSAFLHQWVGKIEAHFEAQSAALRRQAAS